MLIKQDPANPCLVREVCPDGSLGCVVIDISLCVTNPAPGSGTTPPSAGHCETVSMGINAHNLTPLPFLVNTGDTIQLVSAIGAGTDGGGGWFCPDGNVFLAGACIGGGGTVPSDPVPSSFHMSLILKIGANYYPFSTALFTIPGGVINQPIYVQVNDSSLTDDGGDYQLKFTFCNNGAPPIGTWCHHGNFLATPDGFAPPVILQTGICGTPTESVGVWASGVGWKGNSQQDLGCANFLSLAVLRLDLGSLVAITGANLSGILPTPAPAQQLSLVVSTTPDFSSGNTSLINTTTQAPGAYSLGFSGGPITARYVEIYLYWSQGGAAQDVIATSWQISGTGTAPTGVSSSC